MPKTPLLLVALLLAACLAAGLARAQDTPQPEAAPSQPTAEAAPAPSADVLAQIQDMKQRLTANEQENAQLRQRIDDLEKRASAVEEKADTAEKKQASNVEAANKDTKIKVDGRLFAGVLKTDGNGSLPNRTFSIPDAKLRLTYMPSKNITVVTRFSENSANFNTAVNKGAFDYFYLDVNSYAGLFPGHVLRVGKFKMDVGQETWTDNPIESILITNSVSHISGYDTGVNLRGPLGKGDLPATYSLELLNGNNPSTGGAATTDSGLAWSAKLGKPITPQMYVSASYLHTGDLITGAGTLDQPNFDIGEVFSAPAGAKDWNRSLWEVDARYGYGKEGIASAVGAPPATRWQAGATYGQFTDAAAAVADRRGKYWFVEGLYNVTPKTYLATRYSRIDLNNGLTAALASSPVAVNSYNRLSLGGGYRLTPMTHLKLEYTINNAEGGKTKPSLNQIAVGVATKF